MRRGVLLAGVALSLCSTLVLAAPESLLPDIFSEPAPETSRQPDPEPVARSRPQPQAGDADPAPATSVPVIQPVPGLAGPAEPLGPVLLPEDFPSLEEIEAMEPDELDELFGLIPKYDIPPAARREMKEVGLLSQAEGGMRPRSLANQPAMLVRAAIEGTRHPLVSRWGHILLRRTLASRLDAPAGMDPAEFAAMRTELLLRLGEPQVARALVQDIDSGNYDGRLANAAYDAYLASADILGICPLARFNPDLIEDRYWDMTRLICAAYAGDESRAGRELNRVLARDEVPDIEALLAIRFAGAAGEGGRAADLDWDGVDELSVWSWSLATALGTEVPDDVWGAVARDRWAATAPAVSLPLRAAAADAAARAGVLSSAAMVDLYGQIHVEQGLTGEEANRAALLRTAYVGNSPAARLDAMRALWGAEVDYGRQVLTAYAAARMPVSEDLLEDAAPLIASMLAAGLDRNALRWGSVVSQGSEAWALLALVQEDGDSGVSQGALDGFLDEDTSAGQRKSRFLVAGLAGLGSLDSGAVGGLSGRLGIDLGRESPWSRMITRAADVGNPTLVALLVGLGMQGDGWNRMTARHLYHIVRSLDRVGLSAEARMIAAEAVARG